MVAGILSDLAQIGTNVQEAIESAKRGNDSATANLLADVLNAIEERRWMFRAYSA